MIDNHPAGLVFLTLKKFAFNHKSNANFVKNNQRDHDLVVTLHRTEPTIQDVLQFCEG